MALSGGDIAKVDDVMYSHSFANLCMYSKAVPHYDDIDEDTPTPKIGAKDVTVSGIANTETKKLGNTTKVHCTGFDGFIGAMASLGGIDLNKPEDTEVYEVTIL